MKLTFLGTGWSHGVPMIGCDCDVCQHPSPRNRRSRSSIRVEVDGFSLIVDTGPDFRDQVLQHGVDRVDAVVITHAHSDHVMGLDDCRRFTWMQKQTVPVLADAFTLDECKRIYQYVRPFPVAGRAIPRLCFKEIPERKATDVGPIRVTSFPVPHGPMPCTGLLLEADGLRVGYVPDIGEVREEHVSILGSPDWMILNSLRYEPIDSHLVLDESLEALRRIGSPKSYLTHMGCALDYEALNPTLPDGVEMAYDGLILES